MVKNINNISSITSLPDRRGIIPRLPDDGRTKSGQAPTDRVTLTASGHKNHAGIKTNKDLTAEERQKINDLKKRDAQVKAHEQAHMAAGGGVVQSGAVYQYETGPDGKQYAVGGEVKIDVSPERTPEATIRKMQQVRRAALAPAQPSGTDRAVAARAAQLAAQAQTERSQQDQNPDRRQAETKISRPLPYESSSESGLDKGRQIRLRI